VETSEAGTHGDPGDRGNPDSGFGRVLSVAVLIGSFSAVVAGAAIWLLLTDPVVVANAVERGEVTPFIEQLAGVLYDTLLGLLKYF
jgi:hypothetical protein